MDWTATMKELDLFFASCGRRVESSGRLFVDSNVVGDKEIGILI
jgi:hypothetical protein